MFNKMFKTKLSAAVLAAAAAASPVQAEGEYGILMKTLANPFWGAMGQGVEDGAKAADVEYFIQAVESDQAAESQLNVCNTMLERRPVAMITAAINSTNLLPCLKSAQDAGIKIVDLDGNLDPAILDAEGIEITFRIGSDNVLAGAQGAEFMVGQLGADATGPVLVIEGLSGNITGQNRTSGFADKLAELAPGLEIVASLPGDWDRGKAANITNDILTRNPDLVGIFAANDGMALGAVESVFAAGKGGDVVIIGVDGNSDAVTSIQAGRLTASVAQLPYLVGQQAVENVKAVLEGGDVEPQITVPTLVLTKEVMDAGTDPLLESVK
ncbi:substrate-binding domain-containing protein [Primorskyibacter flagellatus]|uniref:D-allose transport system substrate-binding protein n=1 Tax=Primorskyibacter flagellatus TaxID=1387277 RepID=A0A1W2CAW7_9RHOB|nr:substrate-binding domain-containing protein [Primorskyibacter flagellatus]SMC82343.1 D-allose transport system substrate-binding protein [Primorskyibacter flagellatus]